MVGLGYYICNKGLGYVIYSHWNWCFLIYLFLTFFFRHLGFYFLVVSALEYFRTAVK
jgi:hypothetical protein